MHQNYSPPTRASQNSTKRKSISEVVKVTDERKKKKTVSQSLGQSSKSFCRICFDSITGSNKFRNNGTCDHLFCNDCISKHVSTQINKNKVKVNCPIPECSVELKLEHLKPILPNKVIIRWETAMCESSIDWRQKFYCPFKNCSVLLVNDGGEIVTTSECPSCHRLFCAQCKVPWHGEMSCREFQKMKKRKDENYLDLKFFELAKRKMWQNCPKCSFYVNRTSGCEHIVCRCGSNFCYKCGKDWKHGHICNTARPR